MSSENTFKAEKIKFKPGTYIYQEYDEPDNFYQLWNGTVEIILNGETVTTIDDREFPLGSNELVLDIPRQTSVKVTEEAIVKEYNFNKDTIFEWYSNHPIMVLKSIKNNSFILDRLNQLNRDLFKVFRKFKENYDPIVKPLYSIYTEAKLSDSSKSSFGEQIDEALSGHPIKSTLESYKSIIDQTGKSTQESLDDLSIPSELEESFDSGSTLCEEGKKGENFFILISGTLTVLKEGQRVATIDESGSVFGEMATILDGKRTATVKAETDCEIAVFPFDTLPNWFRKSPEMGKKLMLTFLRRCEKAFELKGNLEKYIKGVKRLSTNKTLTNEFKDMLEDITSIVRNTVSTDNRLQDKIKKLKPWIDGEKQLGTGQKFSDRNESTEGFGAGEIIQ